MARKKLFYPFFLAGLLKKNLLELTNHISEKEKELIGSEGSKFTVEVCTETSDSGQLTGNERRLSDGKV